MATEQPNGGMVPFNGNGSQPDQNQLLMQLFTALLGGGQQQQRGITPEDLRTATRSRRLNSAGFEIAPTEAEQIQRDNAAWAARFPKITDPAIRASQGRTAENQWAALGHDPVSVAQAQAGQTGMNANQMDAFAGLMQNGPGSARSIARQQTQQDVGHLLNPSVGNIVTPTVAYSPRPSPDNQQPATPFNQQAFEAANPGLAAAIRADVTGQQPVQQQNVWGALGQLLNGGKKTKVTSAPYPGATRG